MSKRPPPSTRPGAPRGAGLLPWPAVVGMLIGLTTTAPARADDQPDQDRARAAVQAGQVLPLKTLLQRLQREHPGQLLDAELEQEHGRWVYEIKLLQPGGQLLKLEVDARTGQVLQRRLRGHGTQPTDQRATQRAD